MLHAIRTALVAATLAGTLASQAALALLTVGQTTTNANPTAGGAAFAYTITITNGDAAFAVADLALTDALPAGVIFQSVTVSDANAGAFICSGPPVGTRGTVDCSATSLPASGTATFVIVAQIAADSLPGVITNTARVIGDQIQYTASQNQSVQSSTSLSIAVEAPSTVIAGKNLVTLISLSNSGNSSARDVEIAANLPPATSFVSVEGSGVLSNACWFDVDANALRCATPVVSNGIHTANLVVRTKANSASGTISSTASITDSALGTTVSVPSSTRSTALAHSRLDIDANNAYDPYTDGLLMLRYLFGLRGNALINAAIGANAQRTTAAAIESYLRDIIGELDVDGNGKTDALTDGILLVRYLLNLRGTALTQGAVGPNPARGSSATLVPYIGSMTPP